jgi:hypothetical protein
LKDFNRENRSIESKTYSAATLSTTNLTWTDLRSKKSLCDERRAVSRVNHGTFRNPAVNLHYCISSSVTSQRTENASGRAVSMLLLCRETSGNYYNNCTEYINIVCG